jgi:cytidylate kinase
MRTAGHTPPGVEALVERQAERWSLEEKRRGHVAPQLVPLPCVAFSQLPYSGGDKVAARVATALDFGLFDSVIVREIARREGINESLVKGLDQRMRGVIERYITDVFHHHPLTEDEYFRQAMRIVSTIGQRGRAVLVGRGAPFMLAPEHTLRVLVVASDGVRAERCAGDSGLSLEQARAQVAEDDRQRQDFLSFHFRIRQDDPRHYDITLNTDHLQFEQAAHVVADLFRRRFPEAKSDRRRGPGPDRVTLPTR